MNKITIKFVEQKSGVKLTYPNQRVPGDMNEEKYAELIRFGCSDIWDDNCSWMHRDCFSRQCKKCKYYPIVQEYNKKNNISDNVETYFVKAFSIPNLLSKWNGK